MTEGWAGRLRLAMRMGVAPEAFWRLSLAEWRALTEAAGAPALGRAGLEALMAAHPDKAARVSPHPTALRSSGCADLAVRPFPEGREEMSDDGLR